MYTDSGRCWCTVHDVDLSLRRGKILGIVGESGSGESTLAATVLGLLRPAVGHICINSRPLSTLKTASTRRPLYSQMQVVFQDPFGSLSPRMTIEQIIGEGLAVHRPDVGARATSAERKPPPRYAAARISGRCAGVDRSDPI